MRPRGSEAESGTEAGAEVEAGEREHISSGKEEELGP